MFSKTFITSLVALSAASTAFAAPVSTEDAILARELEIEARKVGLGSLGSSLGKGLLTGGAFAGLGDLLGGGSSSSSAAAAPAASATAAAPAASASASSGGGGLLSDLEGLFKRELSDEELQFMKRTLETRLSLGSLGSLLGKGAGAAAGKGAGAAEAGAASSIGDTIKNGLVNGLGSALGGTAVGALLGGGSSSSSSAAAAPAASATAAAPAASASSSSGGGLLSDIEGLFRRESSIDELD